MFSIVTGLDGIELTLKSIIKDEDGILIKASNGMKYYELAEVLKKNLKI